MNTKNLKLGTLALMICTVIVVSILLTAAVSKASSIEVWATDPSGTYPVVLGTKDWVLIGTAFGENFEHGYQGQATLEGFLLNSILQISPTSKATVGVYSGGDSGDINGMKAVMDKFVAAGSINSYNQTAVNPTNPLDINVNTLKLYDVIVLDPPTIKGPDWEFPVTQDTQNALKEYLKDGGKIIASSYLFVYWYDYTHWGRKLDNEDLSTLFGGALPDINNYTPSAITSSPFSQGGTVDTYNVAVGSSPNDPYFHYFLETTPVPEPSTLLLLASGLMGLVGFRKKFTK